MRINVNLVLDAGLEAYARLLNTKLVSQGFDAINFSHPSHHIPHITLLMGEVPSDWQLAELIEACGQFASKAHPFEYQTSAPHWSRPGGSFLFTSTEPQETFRLFRYQLQDSTLGRIEYDEYGGPENESHITLGYVKASGLDLAPLVTVPRPSKSFAQTIRVCATGSRGTCVREFWRASLLGAA